MTKNDTTPLPEKSTPVELSSPKGLAKTAKELIDLLSRLPPETIISAPDDSENPPSDGFFVHVAFSQGRARIYGVFAYSCPECGPDLPDDGCRACSGRGWVRG